MRGGSSVRRFGRLENSRFGRGRHASLYVLGSAALARGVLRSKRSRVALALAAVITLVVATLVASNASASRLHVFIPDGDQLASPRYRPSAFSPTGDGSLYITSIHWTSYNGAIARGRGIAHIRDFNAPPGRFVYESGKVRIRAYRRRFLCDKEFYARQRILWRRKPPIAPAKSETFGGGVMGGCHVP